jgi:hypothetical protein
MNGRAGRAVLVGLVAKAAPDVGQQARHAPRVQGRGHPAAHTVIKASGAREREAREGEA